MTVATIGALGNDDAEVRRLIRLRRHRATLDVDAGNVELAVCVGRSRSAALRRQLLILVDAIDSDVGARTPGHRRLDAERALMPCDGKPLREDAEVRELHDAVEPGS